MDRRIAAACHKAIDHYRLTLKEDVKDFGALEGFTEVAEDYNG